MTRAVAATVAFLVVGCIASQDVSACGDKFLLLGRGVRFQRAYAAIHPAAILIVIPAKSVKAAAVRDSRLTSALKMAGHRVDVVKVSQLQEALAGSRYDIILAERADTMGVRNGLAAASKKPAIIGVIEDSGTADGTAARLGLDAVLKTPQSLPDILRLLDDVMKARIEKARAAAI
jgi:hypothetical protein